MDIGYLWVGLEKSLVYTKTFIAEYYSYIDVLKTRGIIQTTDFSSVKYVRMYVWPTYYT